MKEIIDCSDYYITKEGKVISKKWGKTRMLRPVDNARGYLSVRLSIDGVPKRKFIHRLVAEYFVDGYKNDLQVNHIDGNKHNNHATNLEWCTSAENSRHAVNIGLMTHCYKTPLNAREVIDLLTGKCYSSIISISKDLKISPSTVRRSDRFYIK